MEIDESCLHNLVHVNHLAHEGTGHDATLDIMEEDQNLEVPDSYQARNQGTLSQGSGGDGMMENLLTDATAPDSPAKKRKKRPPRQSMSPSTKSDCRQTAGDMCAF